MKFKEIIREKREQIGLRQVDVGDKVGITKVTVCDYEYGRSYPTNAKLRQLCDVLKLDFNDMRELITQEKEQAEIEKAQQRIKILRSEEGEPPIESFYSGLLQERLVASGPGARILVVNTAQEIPLEFQHGPTLDANGVVKFVVGLNPAALPLSDEDKFYLDVLFLLMSEPVLLQTIVGKKERNQLRSVDGLELQTKLPETPELESFLIKLREKLSKEGRECLALPQTAFALRIWWKENQAEA